MDNINWGRTRLLNKSRKEMANTSFYEHIPATYSPVITDKYISSLRNFIYSGLTLSEQNILTNKLISFIYFIGEEKRILSVDDRVSYDIKSLSFSTLPVVDFKKILNGADIIVNSIRPTINNIDKDLYTAYQNSISDIHKLAWLCLIIIYITAYYENNSNSLSVTVK